MKTRTKFIITIVLLIFFTFTTVWFLNSQLPNNNPLKTAKSTNTNYETAIVTKVIDGDTIIIADGTHVRLLGIDADEKGAPCYEAARQQLENLILSQTVILESDQQDVDQYGRKLRYVFLNGKNINTELVAQGLAIARFYPENQKYKNEITAAENTAMSAQIGCKWNHQNSEVNSTSTVIINSNSQIPSNNFLWKNIVGTAIEPCAAKNYLDQETIIEGKVFEVYSNANGNVFLNFGSKYPNNCFTAVIFKNNLSKFNTIANLEQKTIRLKGKITQYQGKPEIILQDVSQIEITN